MVALILFAGLAFWSGLAFFGVRNGFRRDPNSKVADLMRKVRDLSPAGVVFPALGCIGIGVLVTLFQISRIEAMEGVVGPLGMLGWLFSIFGAALLASRVLD